MNRRLASAATLLTVLALAACSAEPEPAPVTAVIQTPTPAPTMTTPAPTPADPGSTATRSRPVNQISINAAQTNRTAAAAAAATTFMRAAARPELSRSAWNAGVAPLLTASAREAAQTVDPAMTAAHKVTGTATVLPGAETDARTVTVPTDAGTYTLFLRWDQPTARWLVQTYQPPEIHHDE